MLVMEDVEVSGGRATRGPRWCFVGFAAIG